MSKFCFDAGHGGNDSGAVGPRGSYESDFVLNICTRAGEYVRKQGHEVIYTRTLDDFIGLDERAAIANSAGADYFISCHLNSCDTPEVNGIETYCCGTGGNGEKLSEAILEELLQVLGLRDRGVKVANFAVLRETNMPATLVEASFISNADEEERLSDPGYRDKIAKAIAKGVIRATGNTWNEPQQPTPQTPEQNTQAPDGKLFKIQVGAYKNRAGAEELLQQIKAAGFDAFIKLE